MHIRRALFKDEILPQNENFPPFERRFEYLGPTDALRDRWAISDRHCGSGIFLPMSVFPICPADLALSPVSDRSGRLSSVCRRTSPAVQV